ncbi:cuticle protein 21-like [Ctenocephalides felis]|uniref:cuticle protein 21-like n=1 Tax=Ctenocephalides felis TaxID=7515 RepID=UPI000E6E1AF8|nr:cuticle protein 21-like [Ctenocephalides felis]
MAFKLFAFAAVLAVTRAGVLPEVHSYSSSYSSPVAYAAAPAVVKAPVAYAAPAPVAYAAPAPVAYAAPAHYAAPVVAKAVAPVAYAAPVVKTVVEAPAEYSYGYSVQDPLTGDSKSQHETRHGDAVQGSYSVVDADGHKRTVDYTADAVNGFNAVVRREPLVAKVVAPVVAKVAAPVAYAAPVVAKAVAPVTYGAPVVAKAVAPVAYAAPVHYAAAPAHYYHH